MTFVISSGHGKYVSGANGIINEVTEARRVVKQVTKYLKQLGQTVYEFHDDTSKTQATNLETIVKYHNSKTRILDISVHFNAFDGKANGTEVLHYNSSNVKSAADMSRVIANALGTLDRGAKERPGLRFLNGTNKPALLLEICFVDSAVDVGKYQANFDKMCRAIAEHLSGKKLPVVTPPAPEPTPEPEPEPTPPPVEEDAPIEEPVLYQVIAGTFTAKENADAHAKAIQDAGFDVYVAKKG